MVARAAARLEGPEEDQVVLEEGQAVPLEGQEGVVVVHSFCCWCCCFFCDLSLLLLFLNCVI